MTSKTFLAKDGRIVVIRPPTWDDLGGLMTLVNSLVDERADIQRTKRVSRDEEAAWLTQKLRGLEEGAAIHRIAAINGEVVAWAGVDRVRYPVKVGALEILVRAGFRGIGIGTVLVQTLIEAATTAQWKVVILDVFATNSIAKNLYSKLGFTEVGRIPREIHRNGKYIDNIRMALELVPNQRLLWGMIRLHLLTTRCLRSVKRKVSQFFLAVGYKRRENA